MILHADARRVAGVRDKMIYGQFIEHFHRQIYGGVYDPGNPLSGEDGLRKDVMDALRAIHVPVLRWPGGCFVSAYHWKDAVGPDRVPYYDKAWKVEEPCTFGTDEYAAMCRSIGCEPYICTNAGTGNAEEMSDWVEYCNLEKEGKYARLRKEYGHEEAYNVKYWSIGNENYGFWEIGAKSPQEWGRFSTEAAKMMLRVDPSIELSAAAIKDTDWNLQLLKNCGQYLRWISIHDYFDWPSSMNQPSEYETCMTYTVDLDSSVRKVRGLLEAMGLEKQIRIAYDEWNLRPWYHPGVMDIAGQSLDREYYLGERNGNDKNNLYTMADGVFTACFLNMCLRNCDIVGMANFAPVVNTRGCIFTHKDGIVLRPTYHVFYLYTNYLGDQVLDGWCEENPTAAFPGPDGKDVTTDLLDVTATSFSDRNGLAIGAVNKDPEQEHALVLDLTDASLEGAEVTVRYICGESKDSYNDIDQEEVPVLTRSEGTYHPGISVTLPPHSVSVIEIR